jgi:hypothetical protein
MDQGTGNGDSDYTVITMTAYDQFDNPYTHDFSLVAEDDSCFFSLTAGGVPISDVVTAPITGTAQVYLSCMKAGPQTISIYEGRTSLAGQLSVIVTQVVSCEAVLSVTGPDSALIISSALIIGLDNPVFTVMVQDLTGNPVDLAEVSFQDQNMINGVDRTSNEGGIVTYTPTPYTTPGTDSWYVQQLGGTACNPQYFPPLVWWWGVNCQATIVSLSATTLPTDQPFILSGTWYPSMGASLAGATVMITIGENSIPIILNNDGTWTYTIYWNPIYGNSMVVGVSLPGSSEPCEFFYTVTWTQPQPDCQTGFSALWLSPPNPESDTTPTMYIHVLDNLGNPIPYVSYSFFSISRGGTAAAFSWSGTTNINGFDSFLYPNDDYGAYADYTQATVTGTASQCILAYTVAWTAPS